MKHVFKIDASVEAGTPNEALEKMGIFFRQMSVHPDHAENVFADGSTLEINGQRIVTKSSQPAEKVDPNKGMTIIPKD